MRKSAVGLALLLALLAGSSRPGPVRAHAQFREATPGPGMVLATTPPRLQILFDEDLDSDKSQVRVVGPTGERADRRDAQVSGQRMWVSLYDRGPGVYQVRWKAIADDDKGETRGDFSFTIQPQLPAGAPQLSVSPAQANSGQTVTLAGSGFAPSGTVVLSIGDGDDFLSAAQTDGGGRFSQQVALPNDLPYGRQVVQAADAAERLATAALTVPIGSQPSAIVRMSADPQPDEIDYTIRVENRSGYFLRNVVVRADVPPGTQVLAEGLGQPEGVDHPTLEGGQVVWKAKALPAHSILGPFTFNVLTVGLQGRPQFTTTAPVQFSHTATPQFRGAAQSDEVRVQVANR
jgi:methionine-rich copper-binding protein CopC